MLFYNTDLCEAAGLLQDGVLPPLEGEDAFLDALDRAKSAGAANALVCSVTADPATNWRNFQSLYSQLGGEVLADNGSRVVLDDDKATQALEYLRGLVDQELLAPDLDYGGSIALFSSGESAFYVQGEWEISTFLTAETPFSMTLYPNVFGGSNYTVQADSHVLVLPRQPGGGGAMRWERSMRFITSMLEQSLTWAMGGHVPSYLPVRDSDEYQELSPQSAYAEAADAAVYDPPAWYSGSGSDFETVMGESIAGVYQRPALSRPVHQPDARQVGCAGRNQTTSLIRVTAFPRRRCSRDNRNVDSTSARTVQQTHPAMTRRHQVVARLSRPLRRALPALHRRTSDLWRGDELLQHQPCPARTR